jgi:hypothetical protein
MIKKSDFVVGSIYSCTDLGTGSKTYYILVNKRSLDAEFRRLTNMESRYYFNYDQLVAMQEFEYVWEKES